MSYSLHSSIFGHPQFLILAMPMHWCITTVYNHTHTHTCIVSITHSMHAARDTVLPICLSNAGTASKQMEISSYFLDVQVWASFEFSMPYSRYKISRVTPQLEH